MALQPRRWSGALCATAQWRIPSEDEAQRIAETARVKYAKYGYPISAESYTGGVRSLRPTVVLAWDRLNIDATRFVFSANQNG
jgi:hypothetical protein